MKMLAIRKGLSINLDKVIAVERATETTSTIYTETQQFESHVPYEAMLQIIATTKDKKDEMARSLRAFRE